MRAMSAVILVLAIATLWVVGVAVIWTSDLDQSESVLAIRLAIAWSGVCLAGASGTLALRQYVLNERWRRAEAARSMVDRMIDDQSAVTALEIVLPPNDERFDVGGESMPISIGDVRAAFRDPTTRVPKHQFIRREFETLAFYFARLEIFLSRGRVDPASLAPLLSIHARALRRVEPELSAYFVGIGLRPAADFLERMRDANERLAQRETRTRGESSSSWKLASHIAELRALLEADEQMESGAVGAASRRDLRP